MKRLFIICSIIMSFSFIFTSCDLNSYPMVYYFNNDGGDRTEFTLNRDMTAKIKTKMGENVFTYDTSFSYWDNDQIAIKKNGGGFFVIREGYLYQDREDAKAKRYGVKITKQK